MREGRRESMREGCGDERRSRNRRQRLEGVREGKERVMGGGRYGKRPGGERWSGTRR